MISSSTIHVNPSNILIEIVENCKAIKKSATTIMLMLLTTAARLKS